MKFFIYAILAVLAVSGFVGYMTWQAPDEMQEQEEIVLQQMNAQTVAIIQSLETQSEDYEPGFHEESMKEMFAQSNAQTITWETADGQVIEAERGELS